MGRQAKVPEGVFKVNGSKYYHYYFRHKGKVHRGTTKQTLKGPAEEFYRTERERITQQVKTQELTAAQQNHKFLEAAVERMIQEAANPPAPPKEPDPVYTVREILAHWVERAKVIFTRVHVESVLFWHQREDGWLPFQDTPIQDLKKREINDVQTKLMEQYSNGTVNKATSAISIIAHHAVTEDFIKMFPFEFKRLPESSRKKRTLTLDEARLFIQTVGQVAPLQHAIAIFMMLGIGLREIEALNATWDGFYRTADGELVYELGREKSMKPGKDPRVVPVPGWLERRLIRYREIINESGYRVSSQGLGRWGARKPLERANRTGTVSGLIENFVIPAADGLQHVHSFTRNTLIRVGNFMGIGPLSPHFMRATFAEHLLSGGMDLDAVAQNMGHENVETTRKWYIGRSLPRSRAIQEKIGDDICPMVAGEVKGRLEVNRRDNDAPETSPASPAFVDLNAIPEGPASRLMRPTLSCAAQPNTADVMIQPPLDVEIIEEESGRFFMPRRPGKELLSRLVQDLPMVQIAKIYGVSDVAIAKWCKEMQIEKPGRGYWAKVQAAKAKMDLPKALEGAAGEP